MRQTALAIALSLGLASGCTRESLRVALEAQQRADQVQQTILERQHDALRVLLYRDVLRRIEQAGGPLNDGQRAAINDVWNERDLIEFWLTQYERARALRLIGVDAKLYSDQAVVDLLWKSLASKVERAKQGLAAPAAEAVTGDR